MIKKTNMNNELYINQSLIKDLIKYQNDDLCGLIFMNKWINHQFGQGTKSNNLGHYFEYLCTGALAKGEFAPPKPEYNKNGSLSTDYDIAKQQSVFFNNLIMKYGIKLISVGDKVLADDKWICTLDILASWENLDQIIDYDFSKNPEKKVIIDLKFSGLLEDKWNQYGWHYDTLAKKKGTMLQAKHYKFLFYKKYGFNPPFFFFVFDTKNVGVVKIINIEIDDYELEQYESFLFKAKKYLEIQLEKGFEPKPKYSSCVSCKYSTYCAFKADKPEIVTIKPE